jgi:hypothetical protein
MLVPQRCGRASSLGGIVEILLTLNSNARENADRVMLDLLEHRTKHLKGLALILLLRVLLRVRPQPDALSQVVHGRQMFLPVHIELPQHHLFFNVAHQLAANRVFLGFVGFVTFLQAALENAIFIEGLVLANPAVNIQPQTKF